MISDAIDEELMPAEKNPFNKIKLKGQKTFREFLLDDELGRIESLDLKQESIINHHRNLYVFSAYSGGVRISDLLMMDTRNVSKLCIAWFNKSFNIFITKTHYKNRHLKIFYCRVKKKSLFTIGSFSASDGMC